MQENLENYVLCVVLICLNFNMSLHNSIFDEENKNSHFLLVVGIELNLLIWIKIQTEVDSAQISTELDNI